MSTADVPATPALRAWVDDSRVAPRNDALVAARAAMHAARVTQRPAAARRWFLGGASVGALAALQRHPIRLTLGSMATAAGLVLAGGWNAGPGSPLHTVQLARENASLALASATGAAELRLGYAETRLAEAQAASGHDRRDSLAEAVALLSGARNMLPGDHANPLWVRWTHDERLLTTLLLSANDTPGGSGGGSGSGGGQDGTRGGADSSGHQPGGSDDGNATAPGAPAPSATPDDHGGSGDGGSGSGKQPAPITPAPTSDGGGHGDDRGAALPSPPPTPHGHGGDG